MNLEKSSKIKTRVVKKQDGFVYTANIRRLQDAYFYTSRGYRCVNVAISTILVETKIGQVEVIAGKSMMDAVNLIRELSSQKIAFEDIGECIELGCNYKSIDDAVERIVKFEDLVSPKTIAK